MILADRLVLVDFARDARRTVDVVAWRFRCPRCKNSVYAVVVDGSDALWPVMHCGNCWDAAQRMVKMRRIPEKRR